MTTGYLPYFFEVEQDHLRERLQKEAREAVRIINQALRKGPKKTSHYRIFLKSKMSAIFIDGICCGDLAAPYFIKVHTVYGWERVLAHFKIMDTSGYVFLKKDSPIYEMVESF